VSFDGVPPTPRDMADALIDLAHRRELKALTDQVAGPLPTWRSSRRRWPRC
jgi:hypothetical protein